MPEPIDALKAAEKVHLKRNPRYGGIWRSYELISLVDICLGKSSRVKGAVFAEDWAEAKEELEDLINFASYAWTKVVERQQRADVCKELDEMDDDYG